LTVMGPSGSLTSYFYIFFQEGFLQVGATNNPENAFFFLGKTRGFEKKVVGGPRPAGKKGPFLNSLCGGGGRPGWRRKFPGGDRVVFIRRAPGTKGGKKWFDVMAAPHGGGHAAEGGGGGSGGDRPTKGGPLRSPKPVNTVKTGVGGKKGGELNWVGGEPPTYQSAKPYTPPRGGGGGGGGTQGQTTAVRGGSRQKKKKKKRGGPNKPKQQHGEGRPGGGIWVFQRGGGAGSGFPVLGRKRRMVGGGGGPGWVPGRINPHTRGGPGGETGGPPERKTSSRGGGGGARGVRGGKGRLGFGGGGRGPSLGGGWGTYVRSRGKDQKQKKQKKGGGGGAGRFFVRFQGPKVYNGGFAGFPGRGGGGDPGGGGRGGLRGWGGGAGVLGGSLLPCQTFVFLPKIRGGRRGGGTLSGGKTQGRSQRKGFFVNREKPGPTEGEKESGGAPFSFYLFGTGETGGGGWGAKKKNKNVPRSTNFGKRGFLKSGAKLGGPSRGGPGREPKQKKNRKRGTNRSPIFFQGGTPMKKPGGGGRVGGGGEGVFLWDGGGGKQKGGGSKRPGDGQCRGY